MVLQYLGCASLELKEREKGLIHKALNVPPTAYQRGQQQDTDTEEVTDFSTTT